MTISRAFASKARHIKRKGWGSIFLSHCNGTIYIHSGVNDPIGRDWHPTVNDLIATDWIAG
jgi:hypothetical protein